MKNYFLIILAAMLLILACNTPGEQKPGSDTANGVTDSSAMAAGHNATKEGNKILTGDNIVKSEAPDAETPSDQGYAMPRDDQGKAQSPINILTQEIQKGGKATVSIVFHGDMTKAENLGHTVQLDFGDGSTGSAEGKTLTVKQFHFHTPSEHLIDGMTFPMEMHIVSSVKDTDATKAPSNVVVGILFKMGKENPFIKKFLDMIPKEEGKQDIQSGKVHIEELLAQVAGVPSMSFYTYDGSLTTPPFSENVHWIVLDHPLEASPAQIMAIEKIEGNNARHVQATGDRKISNNQGSASLH